MDRVIGCRTPPDRARNSFERLACPAPPGVARLPAQQDAGPERQTLLSTVVAVACLQPTLAVLSAVTRVTVSLVDREQVMRIVGDPRWRVTYAGADHIQMEPRTEPHRAGIHEFLGYIRSKSLFRFDFFNRRNSVY